MNAREGALKVLYEVEVKGAYSNIALNKELKNDNYKGIDRSFITELVYGVLENQMKLDFIIQQFSTMKLKKMNIYVLLLIRLGLYQVLFLNKVPPSAAINESVNLSKKYCRNASGFINGVLRNIIRGKDNIKLPTKEENKAEYLSIKYSHPLWMVESFLNYYGDATEEILIANNQKPQLYIRVNTLLTTVEDTIKALTNKGIRVKQNKFLEEALAIEGDINLNQLEELKKGYIYIQDFASMLIGRILDPKENDFVIDVCSAPGGKTTHIAQLMNNKGRILARDIYKHKLKLIEKNAKTLGIQIIKTEEFDAKKLDVNLIASADGVLVDAPCSGLGIIRRKPEIKYRKTPDDIKTITGMQLNILNNAAEYVKAGGTLVYSTCTIDPRENHEIIHRFLEGNKTFTLVNLGEAYGYIIPGKHEEPMIQLLPGEDGTDGFFICKLMKDRN